MSSRWLGVVERIMFGAWLLWMAVLAVDLFRVNRETAHRQRRSGDDRPR